MRGTSKSSLILAACAALTAGQVMGASITWSGAGDGTTWSQGANWVGGVAPMTGDTATFNAIGGTHLTVTVDVDTTVDNISVTGSTAYTINAASGKSLSINGAAAGGRGTISTSGAGTSLTVNAPIVLLNPSDGAQRAGYFSAGADSSLTLNGNITAAGSTGFYDFHLSNGTGSVNVNGNVSSPVRFYSNSARVGTTAYLNGVNTTGITMDVTWGTYVLNHAGAVTSAPVSAVRGGNVVLAVANALTGTGSLNMTAANAQEVWTNTLIQADQNYTGNTSIIGQASWVGGPDITASLRVNNGHNSSGSATGSGNVNVSGALLAGDGKIINAGTNGVTLTKNGSVQGYLSPGAVDGQVGTLAFDLGSKGLDITGAVAGPDTGALLFDLDTVANSDRVELLGTTALKFTPGTLEFDDFVFNPLSGFGAGTYTLFSSVAPINGSLGSNLTGTVGGLDATLGFGDVGQHSIVLTVVPEPGTLGTLAIGALGLLVRRRRGA